MSLISSTSFGIREHSSVDDSCVSCEDNSSVAALADINGARMNDAEGERELKLTEGLKGV